MPQSIILTGLDLVRSKQEADPGSLSACENFEISNIRGLTKIQGINAFSGGVQNDVVDPYVLHSYGFGASFDPLDLSSNLVDVVNPSTFTEGTIVSWGSGGNFNYSTGELANVDGTGVVCFLRTTGAELMLIALCNIQGRLPASQDFITNGSGGFAMVSTVPWLASKIVADLAPYAFGSYTNTVDSISQLIAAFDLSADENTHGWPLPSNPLGSVKGGFLFRDRAYAIMDIETRAFTLGAVEPAEGDTLLVAYSGTYPAGGLLGYTVDKVFTDSGDWSAGTAVGRIQLIQLIGTDSYSSIIRPTDTQNLTTGAGNPLLMGAVVRSSNAIMMKQGEQTDVTDGDIWTRVDLGYEVRFSSGDAFPTVLNRSNRDSSLEATVTTTDWVTFGTASGWTNSSNAIDGSAGTFASQSNDGVVRPPLVCTNAGFNLPSTAVILGIEVEVGRRKQATGFISARDREVRLVGVPGQSQDKKKNELWPTVTATASYGGASDLWNTSLSAEVVNSSSFGMSISAEAVNGSGGNDRQIDSVRVRITYKDRSSLVYFGDTATTAITSVTSVTTTATVTTTAAHGFTTGQSVTISGANQAEYNGTYTITVTGLTTFTYTFAGSATTPATGTIVAFRNFSTARVIWYHKEKGDWTTNDAQGTLTLYEVSAPSAIKAGQIIRNSAGASGTTYATAASACERVYLASSNAQETNAAQWDITDQVNFFGSVGLEQVLMASGADFGGTFDGTYYIRVRTGVEANQDKPRHVVKHLDQAFWGYIQGVTIASDLGYPESTAGVVGGTLGGSSPISDDTSTYPTFAGGAQQVLHGDSVYGYIGLSKQSMGVMCRNSIRQIVGSGGALVDDVISSESGIIEYTLKNVGQPVFCDYRGIGTVAATDAFGDFARGRLSDPVSPWLLPRLQQAGSTMLSNTGPIGAQVIRNKNQYRVFFRDRYCLTMTMVGNGYDNPQFTTQYLPFVPACTFTGVTSGGKDMLFLAPYGMAEYGAFSNDLKAEYEDDTDITIHANVYAPSFLYQGDVGTTWDRKLPINASFEINGGAAGREWEVKHYDKMLVHGQCYGFAPFGARFAVNFEEVGTGTPQNVNGGSTSGAGSLAFDLKPFSKVEKVRTSIGSDGYALTIQFVSNGDSVYGATTTQTSPYKFRPFTIQSIILISEPLKTRPSNAGT